MSLITKNNYEAFLLDYVEGNLSHEHTAELMLFFENHPELKEDLEDFDIISLTPENIEHNLKNELKVEEGKITAINFEEAVIAEIEDENSEKEQAALFAYLKQNPEREKVLEAYKKTKLVAPVVIFEDKTSLKQTDKKVIPLYWWYSAAAAVILILFLLKGISWNTENETLPIPIADEINTELPIENTSEEKTSPIIEEEIQQQEIAVIEEVIIPDNILNEPKQKELNQEIEDVQQPIEIEEPEVIYANDNLPIETEKIDSSQLETTPINNIEEEILLADDVKIIYEDEEPTETNTNKGTSPRVKKVSKLRMLREAFTHKVKDKLIAEETNQNGEVIAQAFNVGPFNFSRNRK